MMFWFVHSKSKASPIAWRMRASLNCARRVLNHQPWMERGPRSGIVSRLTRPSLAAGKS